MEENTCKNCGYFYRHYAMNERKIFRINCGHCTCGRTRTRKPGAKPCAHFVQAEPDEEAFASKEYLSKVLLEYMRKLELLPDIQDLPE